MKERERKIKRKRRKKEIAWKPDPPAGPDNAVNINYCDTMIRKNYIYISNKPL